MRVNHVLFGSIQTESGGEKEGEKRKDFEKGGSGEEEDYIVFPQEGLE